MYVINEIKPGQTVYDSRPRFKTFTEARKMLVIECRELLEEARRSAHKSFKWHFDHPPSQVTKRAYDDWPASASIQIQSNRGGGYYTRIGIDETYALDQGQLFDTVSDYLKSALYQEHYR